MNYKLISPYRKGQSLVELILAFGLAAILLPALLTGLVASREGKSQQQQRLAATGILKEAEEAVRAYRQTDWTTFAVNNTYHHVLSGSNWILTAGSATTNGFTESIVISDVQRDSTNKIVASGGTVDPSTKQVVTTVSWGLPYFSSISSTIYLVRFTNLANTETTISDFNAGTKVSTTVTGTNGSSTDGQVQLGAGGSANWCTPNLSISALDLPKSGVANAVYAISGQAFAGTGDNSSGVSFANISITTPSSGSPTASVSGTFDGYKTNAGVFGQSDYAYLGTDSNSKEVVIVDLRAKDSNNKYSEAGYFNAPGNGSGNSVFVVGNIGYMASGSKLYTFDLSSKSGSRPQLGSFTLPATGNRVFVVNNKAYVAIDATTNQLQILDVANPSAITFINQASVVGQKAKDLYINQSGTIAYLATGTSANQREFFAVDVNPQSATYLGTLGSYDTSGMDPKGVTVVTGNKAIIVGVGAEEYQVISLTDYTRCGGLNIDFGVNGVSSIVDSIGRAYSYIITGDAAAEFKIIEGGPGGQVASSGSFESQTFDPCASLGLCYSTFFNRIVANINQPTNTSLQLQVAVASAINNSCSGVTFTYVGPDPSDPTHSYFTSSSSGTATISGAIPYLAGVNNYQNPGRCFRYKALFSTSDISASPILYDITANYSP